MTKITETSWTGESDRPVITEQSSFTSRTCGVKSEFLNETTYFVLGDITLVVVPHMGTLTMEYVEGNES